MILIVDDSASMRRTIKGILQDMNAEVYECSNGASAVEMYERYRPAWVLMDIKMPGMDGISATRRITQSFPDARIVIVTNYNDPLLRKEAQDAGAIDYVLKDDLSVLLDIMYRAPGKEPGKEN